MINLILNLSKIIQQCFKVHPLWFRCVGLRRGFTVLSYKLYYTVVQSVSSTFVILSRISDNATEDGCRQSSVGKRFVGNYKGQRVFKVNKGGIKDGEVDMLLYF